MGWGRGVHLAILVVIRNSEFEKCGDFKCSFFGRVVWDGVRCGRPTGGREGGERTGVRNATWRAARLPRGMVSGDFETV